LRNSIGSDGVRVLEQLKVEVEVRLEQSTASVRVVCPARVISVIGVEFTAVGRDRSAVGLRQMRRSRAALSNVCVRARRRGVGGRRLSLF
jgi:hypothetical protein